MQTRFQKNFYRVCVLLLIANQLMVIITYTTYHRCSEKVIGTLLAIMAWHFLYAEVFGKFFIKSPTKEKLA